MADRPPAPDGPPAKRLYHRREVIALVGAGGVAAGLGLSWLLTNEAPADEGSPDERGGDERSGDDRRGDGRRSDDRRSERGDRPSSTTEAPAPPPDDGPPPSTVATAEAGDEVTADGLPRARWSDPQTWDGRVPTAGDVATIDRPVLLDVDAEVSGVRIGRRGALVFDPASSRHLRDHRQPRGRRPARAAPGQGLDRPRGRVRRCRREPFPWRPQPRAHGGGRRPLGRRRRRARRPRRAEDGVDPPHRRRRGG